MTLRHKRSRSGCSPFPQSKHAQENSGSIALVGGSLRQLLDGGHEEDAFVTSPIQTDAVRGIIGWGQNLHRFENELMNKHCARFMNRLAYDCDARLRQTAAGFEGLDSSAIASLAADVARDVRLALVQNASALQQLDARTLIEMGQNDSEIAQEVLYGLHQYFEPAPNDDDKQRQYRSKFEAVAGALLKHREPVVCRRAEMILLDSSRKSRARTSDPRGSKVVCSPSEPVFALVFNQPAAESDEGFARPMLFLTLDQITEAAHRLSGETATDEMIVMLASHPAVQVREQIANRQCLPPSALEVLRHEVDYSVRRVLLSNDEALAGLSSSDILRLTANDPLLIEAVFGWGVCQNRVAGILKSAFGESRDPCIREVLAALEEEQTSDDMLPDVC